MFFGHEVKSNNQNKTTPLNLETDIKLSQAVLDPSGKAGNKKEPVCLMAEVEGKSFILAVLDPSQSWQCPLDLVLASGTAVKFYLRGQGTVHLTGYEIRDDMGDDFEMSMESSDEEEEEANGVAEKKTPAKNIPVKAKGKSPTTNGVKPVGKTNGKPSIGGDADDSDEDSSDDEDFNEDDISDDDEDEDDLDSDDVDEISDDDENLSFGEMDSDEEMVAAMDDSDDDDDDEDDDDDN